MTGRWLSAALTLAVLSLGSCDDDDIEADRIGVGAQCVTDEDCFVEGQRCLQEFKGGYCGLAGCVVDEDCPYGSGCVAHDDGENYCFRYCVDKPECNRHRDWDNEANCSSSIVWADPDAEGGKACVPPSA